MACLLVGGSGLFCLFSRGHSDVRYQNANNLVADDSAAWLFPIETGSRTRADRLYQGPWWLRRRPSKPDIDDFNLIRDKEVPIASAGREQFAARKLGSQSNEICGLSRQ